MFVDPLPPMLARALTANLFPVSLLPQFSPLLPIVLNASSSESHQDSDQKSAPSSSKPTLMDSPLYSLVGDLARNPLCLGLMSVSALAAISGGRQIAKGLEQLGSWGEELFRGDRLPLLHNSDADSATDSTEDDPIKEDPS
ncbi:MAG: hypothetical protein ACFCA4_04940 [Cyanophyceae cyanobacterium]